MQYLKVTLLFLIATSCTEKRPTKEEEKIDILSTTMAEIYEPTYKIFWLDSSDVKLKIDPRLSYSKGFKYDSAIAVNYWGWYVDETSDETFEPLNAKGQWISTIKSHFTYSPQQFYFIDSILSDKGSFIADVDKEKIYPAFAILYFKNGYVIGKTILGGGLRKLTSTILLANKHYKGSLEHTRQHNISKMYYYFEDISKY